MKELFIFSKEKILSYYKDAVKLKMGELVIPRMLSVWPSQICNLRCKHCVSAEQNRKVNKFMDRAGIMKVIDEVSKLGVESIEFSGGGEPMLHPDFCYIADFARYKGMKVGILTNGTVLREFSRLVSLFSYIRISLDAVDKDSYNRLKNPVVDGTFDKVKNNIERLLEVRGDNIRPHIGVKFLVSKTNINDIQKAVDLAIGLKVDYVQFKRVHSYEGEITEQDEIDAQKSIDAYKQNNKIIVIGNVKKQVLRGKCFMAPIHAVIDAEGNIYVCCFFDEYTDLKIGNVFENKFVDVWGSNKHKELMRSLDIASCNKRDCRWIFYNNFMQDVIENDSADISFN